MAEFILTGEQFSRNDVSKLAQFFEQSFDYYINHNTPFFSDYLNALRTVVGLGFTASLVDRQLFCIYQHYLQRFIALNEGDFKRNPGSKRGLAQAVAEMTYTAALCFYALHFPRYYEEFIAALHYALVKIPSLSGKQKAASAGINCGRLR